MASLTGCFDFCDSRRFFPIGLLGHHVQWEHIYKLTSLFIGFHLRSELVGGVLEAFWKRSLKTSVSFERRHSNVVVQHVPTCFFQVHIRDASSRVAARLARLLSGRARAPKIETSRSPRGNHTSILGELVRPLLQCGVPLLYGYGQRSMKWCVNTNHAVMI